MNNIKVNLSVVLPGRTMLSEQECSQNPEESYDNNTLVVKNERIQFQTRKCKNARQCLNISEEAYDTMVSKTSCPGWVESQHWVTLSKEQRLRKHLWRICQTLGGISYTYNVLED